MRREYKVDCITGMPKVNYRETCTTRADFNYTHKKQSGGAGQYGKLIGYIEPLPENCPYTFEYSNELVGNVIPPEFHIAIEKGFKEAIEKGLAGYPVTGVRIAVTDGAYHAVDSNEIAFKQAAAGGFREGFKKANPVILEPLMAVDVEIPDIFQGAVVGMLNRRKGMIQNVELRDGGFCLIRADVPLSKMFGYSTDLRSSTEGKGEFSMEYKYHAPVTREEQNKLLEEFEKQRIAAIKK
jgi:elongation factor G